MAVRTSSQCSPVGENVIKNSFLSNEECHAAKGKQTCWCFKVKCTVFAQRDCSAAFPQAILVLAQ